MVLFFYSPSASLNQFLPPSHKHTKNKLRQHQRASTSTGGWINWHLLSSEHQSGSWHKHRVHTVAAQCSKRFPNGILICMFPPANRNEQLRRVLLKEDGRRLAKKKKKKLHSVAQGSENKQLTPALLALLTARASNNYFQGSHKPIKFKNTSMDVPFLSVSLSLICSFSRTDTSTETPGRMWPFLVLKQHRTSCSCIYNLQKTTLTHKRTKAS